MQPIVKLMHRFFDEYVNAHNPDVLVDLLADDFLLSVAGTEVRGRDGYEPFARAFLARFPDVRLTMYETLTDGDRVAMRFTAEVTSERRVGNRAAWGGVGIYTWDDERFTRCWVEEDHHVAREQLRSGRFEPVDQVPGPADPFGASVIEPAPRAVELATQWMQRGGGGRLGRPVRIDSLLVAGSRFAFHTTSPTIHVAGMATIGADENVADLNTFTDGGNP